MFMDKKLLARHDKMLEDGINGTFSESDYDETKLSQLESKWLRYLTSSKLSYQKTTQEREKLKELVSDISHQTKTPIANILLYAELLQEQNLDRQSLQLVDENALSVTVGRLRKKLNAAEYIKTVYGIGYVWRSE